MSWEGCSERPSSSADCRLCLMAGRWHIASVVAAAELRQEASLSYLADGPATSITVVGDDLVVSHPDGLRTHKQITLRPGGLVQRLHLRHVVPHDRGWSGDGTVVQKRKEMHICLSQPQVGGPELACPKGSEHIILRRLEGGLDCAEPRRDGPPPSNWNACSGPAWLAEHCRLRSMTGDWRVKLIETGRSIAYFRDQQASVRC